MQGILSRPPWTWLGVAAPLPPHPEYGLGLDFWPTLLYVNYASHGGLLGAMWAVLVTLLATDLRHRGGPGLAPRPPGRGRRRAWTAGCALAAVCLAYGWLQVQA